MESLLEAQRNCHEERERCIELMVKETLMDKRSQREKVNSEQRVRTCMDRYRAASQKLIDLYSDTNGEREKEIQSIGGPNEFAEFYSRLKILKDFHRKNLNENARPLTVEFQEMTDYAQDPDRVEKELVRFTDEEGYGKFLDMHTLFDQYLNLKAVNRIDYITYLSSFDNFTEIHKDTKKTGAYKSYLSSLLDYLKDFLSRAKPLLDLEGEMSVVDKDFETKWSEGKLPGWTRENRSKETSQAEPIDLSNYNSAEELESIGMDRLKSALLSLNMKCGGTLSERAKRLFDTKGKNFNELASKKSGQDLKEEVRQKLLAMFECQVVKLAQFLDEEREATKENVVRKQARAAGEEEDEEEIEEYVEEVEEDDGSVPYNPKNLPLGWDGKPIPYWLYKLHGLNIGYSCEICGNQVYKGPKAFQRHFTEWRHSHGMRCLGIPNTAHFANVTKIDEAIELWRKICVEKNAGRWNPEADEEFEDSQGNVVNRRTFEDLKRQGLL